MPTKYKIPDFQFNENIAPATVPLEIEEGLKFPEEFIKALGKNIKKPKSRKLKTTYKELRIYKPRPQYSCFEEYPIELKDIFDIALQVLEEPDWITLKRFLNNKSHPKYRWLWGFSLRDRRTERIKINNNDLLVIQEWVNRTGHVPGIEQDKLFDFESEYLDKLEKFIASSDFYGKGKRVEWAKKLYLKEIEKLKATDE